MRHGSTWETQKSASSAMAQSSQRPRYQLQQDSRTTGTPEQYFMAVDNYCKHSKEDFLHPGSHYYQLAQFLSGTKKAAPYNRAHQSSFVHVIVHDWSKEGQTKEVYKGDEGLQKLGVLKPPEPGSGRLIFLRGHSCRNWLLELGAQYRIDPEYFRRHLNFLQSVESYDLPTLPSSSRNIIQLRIITICSREVPLTQDQIEDSRREETKAVQRHQQHLEANGSVGDSMIRRISTHGETTFTLEQEVSLCVKRKNGGWIAIVWLDNGEDLSGPWLSALQPIHRFHRLCHPVIQHRSKAALMSKEFESLIPDGTPETSRKTHFAQNASFLPFQYGLTLTPEIAAVDPTYALSELFTFAASSECQFLNLMQTQVQKDIHFLPAKMEISVANLKYSKSLLDEHVQRLRNTVDLLRNHELLNWPQASQPTTKDTVDRALRTSLLDYEHLLHRAQRLAAQCLEGTNMIMSGAMLAESRKGIIQAEGLTQLTVLAFFFLPLSFTTSLFGTNFKQLGTGILDIWVMLVALVPILSLSTVVLYWNTISRSMAKRWSGEPKIKA